MISMLLGVILLTLLAEPQPSPQQELLPPTPDGWRFERINFPLSFAPDLKYEGFEELRFAPGMFIADSETYFTYLFAMRITNEATFDAPALQSLLETYYRGLCKTVSKESKFDIDVSKISAQVHAEKTASKKARSFRAVIECFDPFVTGKPLTLNLEMIVLDAGPTDHLLFAAVSPKPMDAPIWKTLRSLKDQFLERNAAPPK